ncbi:MAG: diguanylate cyclase [Dehalococcoidales bacterium]|nr:diguanylate cyclase [Dehalococcoidales bacterium]
MQAFSIVPLLAAVVYAVLLVVTVANRPLTWLHKLFLAYLAAALLWSCSDFLLRNPDINFDHLTAFRLVLVFSVLWAIQLYYFSRSFIGLRIDIGTILGYILAVNLAVLCILGIIPPGLTVEGNHVVPVYGWWMASYVTPPAMVAILALICLVKRLIRPGSVEEKTKTSYLIVAIGLLVIFGFIGLTPLAMEIPVSHIGGLLSSIVLAYSVIHHELVSINIIFRKALGWLVTGLIGVVCFNILLTIGHFAFGLEPKTINIVYSTTAAVIVWVVLYFIRPVFLNKIDRIFYRERYQHRKELLDFVGYKIRAVSGLEELGEGFLSPLSKTLGCHQAMVLLPDKPNNDYVTRLTKTGANVHNLSSQLIIGKDSPIIDRLKQNYVTIKDISLDPCLRSMRSSEKTAITDAGIEMFFPLQYQGNLVGILGISGKKTGKYSLEDIRLCENITSTVAITLEKEGYHYELLKREKQLSIINRLSSVINSSLNMDEVYDNFISGLKEAVEFEYASIGTIDNGQLRFSAIFSRVAVPWKPGYTIPLAGSGIEWLVLTKKYIAYPNARPEKSAVYVEKLCQIGLLSTFFIPLISKDEVIGILSLGKKSPQPFEKEQMDLLGQLACQIASSLANILLYSSAQNRARIDELTGLSNRRNFDESINREIRRHFRYGSMLSLIMMDLDQFKGYNDSLGHINGDKLLKKSAHIIQKNCREVDMCFRYGGDEFSILLPNTSGENACTVAERIRENIELAMAKERTPVRVSMGIASWPNDGITPEDLITSADQALYYSKRTGGNRVCVAAQIVPSAGKDRNSDLNNPDKDTLNTIYALAATIEARDRYTYGHSRKVRDYAVALAEALKLSPEVVTVISHAALLHDIGKIGVYDAILNKPDALTVDERELIKNHPVLSRDIVAHIPNLTPCLPAILHHHERWDGKGYPHRLMGESIPVEARILTIADSFDAMTTARPYRDRLPSEVVIQELRTCAGSQFDPSMIEAFIPIALKVLNLSQPSATSA